MPTIGIKQLQPGATTAKDVTSPDGRVLLAKGCTIEPWHLGLFQGLGITDVEIEDPNAQKRRDQAIDYVREFFAFVNPDNPTVISLYNFAVDLVEQKLDQGWSLPSLSVRRAENVEHLADVFPMEIVKPERIVDHETKLASFPDVYFRLRKEIDTQKASVNRLGALVSQDVGLASRLLKLVNSPMYAVAKPVESIDRAISIIGINELSTLALGISAINYFKGIPPELIDMATFWRHSISSGIFANILAKAMGEKNTERFFIAGLLHDAGRLILFKEMPYASSDALIFARENVLPIVEAEQTVFEFTHTSVSEHLLRQWNFPPQLSDLINFHHDPLSASNPREAAVIHVADVFANAMDIATGGMYVLPQFEEKAWDLLGIPADSVANICREHETQVDQTVKAFF
ncbi:MAG: HDOD domain-containing protein [Desulfovibrio sp.]|nr:HDOD domain-containing protein [Desulfovibrio sp.]MBI4959285.1 HDOD domain-containing protein [Desulfovibrio sp.]